MTVIRVPGVRSEADLQQLLERAVRRGVRSALARQRGRTSGRSARLWATFDSLVSHARPRIPAYRSLEDDVWVAAQIEKHLRYYARISGLNPDDAVRRWKAGELVEDPSITKELFDG